MPRYLSSLLTALLLLACVLPVQASEYPSRSIKLIVGYPPGGGADAMARVIAEKLTAQVGRRVVVENVGGASGIIGAGRAAKSKPDGYTLLLGQVNSNAIAPFVYRNLPFDPVADLVPIINVGFAPRVLVVHPDIPAKSVKELVAVLKASPGKYNYAISGYGGEDHLAAEQFRLANNVDIVEIPYNGTGPAMIDLVAGRVSLAFLTLPPSMGFLKDGRLRALAISTDERDPALPEVPTFAEAGFATFEVRNWYGLFAPAKTPSDRIKNMNEAANEMLESEGTQEIMKRLGIRITGGSPEAFGAYLKSELGKFGRITAAAKIRTY